MELRHMNISWGQKSAPEAYKPAVQGQQGLKHTAMALGSQARPVCKKEGLGKTLPTLAKKMRPSLSPNLAVEKGRR